MKRQRTGEAKFDVAIIGGGLAGNLLARQLRRRLPKSSIGLFEKGTRTGFKVGESIVEIGSNYLIRRQGLTRYLYENHLPKNGLRYFFDRPGRDAALTEMSEIGPVNLPFHPGFQIDRSRMEADLLAMNASDGIDVRRGATVHDIRLGAGRLRHRFRVSDGRGETAVSSRWLIDAAGRVGILSGLEQLRVSEETHRTGSAWARFTGVADVDDFGPPEFRARVRHTTRGLSTMHFWYPGYWVWFIPLRNGVTSVGLVGEPAGAGGHVKTLDDLRAFLGQHRAVSSLLAGATPLDFGRMARIAYGTRRFFHPDRWGVTGEAATSADPFYSPGTDFIALENDFLTDLVVRDSAGEAADALAERCDLYDRFMHFRHEAAMLLYRGLYGVHGSYELMRMKWDLDIGCYYNLWVAPYLQDQYLDSRFLKRQLRQQPFILQALRNFAQLFRDVATTLEARGDYYRSNTGHFSYGLEHIDFLEEVGLPRSRRRALDVCGDLFNTVRNRALELTHEGEVNHVPAPLPLASFMSGQPLV